MINTRHLVIPITLSLVILVVGTAGYMMIEDEGRRRIILGRRRLDQKINRLKNHYIVCGYGRIEGVICSNLRRKP